MSVDVPRDVDEHQETTKKDRHFNPDRTPKTDRLRSVVAGILRETQSYERHFGVRKRKRRVVDQETFEATVTAIVCDLIHHQLTSKQRGVAITRSNRILGKRDRYRPKAYGKTLPAVLDLLEAPEMAFVHQEKGYQANAGNKQTVITAGSSLILRMRENAITLDDLGMGGAAEVIILKSRKRHRLDTARMIQYDDTDYTNRYREEIRSINAWLEQVHLDADDALFPNGVADLNDVHLHRTFNNGSFTEGGRLWGGFWQRVSKKIRLDALIIDGEPIAELDYGQMAPRLLYGMTGAHPTHEDLYNISGLDGCREGVKKLLNAAISADRVQGRMPQGTRSLFPSRLRYKDILTRIEEAHAPITPYLFKGKWSDVTFQESEILVALLLRLKDVGVAALPIHDCVLVPKSTAAQVEEIMKTVFREKTGVDAQVSVKLSPWEFAPA